MIKIKKNSNMMVNVTGIYSPKNYKSERKKDEFYEEFQNMLDIFPRN